MSGSFNPELLVLARESRGLSQAEVAAGAGLSQSILSKYENGLHDPSAEHLEAIAKQLQYPVDFFLRSGAPLRAGLCIFHRKQASLGQRELRRLQAVVKIARTHVSKLIEGAAIEPSVSFPRYDIEEYAGDTAKIAEMVRLAWRLPDGPVRNLIQAIEEAGGIVIGMGFGTRQLSAMCHPEYPPIFCVNRDMTIDRTRFSLAHELGHLIMHQIPTGNQEMEADRFAADLLMPAREIRPELVGITLPKAANMKPYWRVSMSALIRRASDLGVITSQQYQNLMKEVSYRHWRLSEPVDIPGEEPTLLDELVRVHREDLGYSVQDLSQLLRLDECEFRAMYLGERWQPRVVE